MNRLHWVYCKLQLGKLWICKIFHNLVIVGRLLISTKVRQKQRHVPF